MYKIVKCPICKGIQSTSAIYRFICKKCKKIMPKRKAILLFESEHKEIVKEELLKRYNNGCNKQKV